MSPSPYLQDSDFTLFCGDSREVLSTLPAESVHMAVTSPPFFGLRDYGTGTWEGGEDGCDHAGAVISSHNGWDGNNKNPDGSPRTSRHAGTAQKLAPECKCGARRVDSQIGLEATVDEWVDSLVGVFREVRRVMRDDATLWIECGDSYQDKQLLRQPFRLAEALQQPYYTGQIKSELDRVWLAATVEAEGCLFIHRRKAGTDSGAKFTKTDGTEMRYARTKDTFGAGLEVSSTDRVVVERCMAIAGFGSICEQTPKQNDRRKQTLYRWNARTNASRRVIAELYPHLIAKQHEARLLIGCPSSGPKAAAAHESLKALHQGGEATIDFPAPASLYEPGMYLRNVCIFHRPNPMPESVRDRFTVSHSYILLFSKSPRYFFDAEAVRESYQESTLERNAYARTKHVRQSDGSSGGASYLSTKAGGEPVFIGPTKGDLGWNEQSDTSALFANDSGISQSDGTQTSESGDSRPSPTGSAESAHPQTTLSPSLPPEAPRGPDGRRQTHVAAGDNSIQHRDGERWPNSGRNARSVWTIATEPLPFEHYAAFPQALAERCIKAGTSERGCCPECGAPWVREVEQQLVNVQATNNSSESPHGLKGEQEKYPRASTSTVTLGWQPSCKCREFSTTLHGPHQVAADPIPCTVLDPFLGSGTTALVSRRLGRRCIGVELNERYCELAATRTQQLSILAEDVA